MSKRPTTPIRSKTKAAAKKAPKSFKSDGTPKKRWSPAERAERGHTPRRGGGQSRSTERREDRGERRDDRYAKRDDRGERRDDRYAKRDDRGERRDDRYAKRDDRTPDRSGRNFARPDRSDRGDRFERSDRGDRVERGDRGDRARKPYSASRPSHHHDRPRPDKQGLRPEPRELRKTFRDDRARERFDRDDRPRFDRDDRPRFDRDDRPRFDRDDRPRFDRDDRPRFDRDDRPQRGDRFERNDRPRTERNDRARFERSDRPQRGDRFERNDRPRNDRPRFERDDRDRFDDNDADQMSWQATEVAQVDEATVADDASFAQLGLPKALVGALDQQGITTPFPIQSATIPDALTGRDVLGRGQTGSGKTLGFGLPMLTRLAAGERGKVGRAPRALVLVPTRELALQVADVLAPLAQVVGLSATLIAGGMAFGPQLKAFDRGVDIVVATPGRLIDLMEQGAANLSEVQVTVLDEADHMADLGFMPAVTTILDAVPADGQRLLFSATLDRGVDRLVKRYLTDPVTHEVDSDRASVTTMEHRILHVLPHDKNAMTAAIANREGRTVVFVRTQRGADRVAEQLRAAGVMAGALHGGLTQGARARILTAFKDGTVPVLVATDVAARGIHVDEVSLVLQVDPPMGPKDYLHRAGRTARAGGTGVVASIVLPHQRREMFRLTSQAGVKAEPIQLRPSDDLLGDLTGARTPEGEAISETDYAAVIAPPKAQRRSRPARGGKSWGRDDRRGGFSRGQGRRPRD